jgi:hypothetical protein
MGADRSAATSRAPGGRDDGLRALREKLAQAVKARTGARIPGLSAHFGEDYEHGTDPEAVAYSTTGGHFRWVAFAFAPWRMWDLHLGVVAIDDHQLSVGFHISERAAPVVMRELERLAAGIGAPVRHQEAAVEYQANLPPIDVDRVSIEELADTVSGLCAQYAQVAGKLACPAQMCATGR